MTHFPTRLAWYYLSNLTTNQYKSLHYRLLKNLRSSNYLLFTWSMKVINFITKRDHMMTWWQSYLNILLQCIFTQIIMIISFIVYLSSPWFLIPTGYLIILLCFHIFIVETLSPVEHFSCSAHYIQMLHCLLTSSYTASRQSLPLSILS